MRIALSMLDQVWENKQENLKACAELAEKSSMNQADLLIFPEMSLTGFTLNSLGVAENCNSSESMQRFSDLANKHNIALVAGVVLSINEQLQNCAVAFGRNGEQLCCYAKIHPFSPSGENVYITGGVELSTFEYEGVRFGMTICYDLRFPLLWSALAEECDCIINIANWPAKRVDHWKALLQARAIENQIYVIGVNRVGLDGNKLDYVESSYAFAPDGSMLTANIISNGLVIIEIDQSIVKKNQADFPIRNDRRFDLYKKFLFAET